MKETLLYEGKAKRLFQTDDPTILRVVYKDDATALNGKRKEVFSGKGRLNNQITSLLFDYLRKEGIPSHFIKAISEIEQLVKAVTVIPLEVVVRNKTAGSLSKRLGRADGETIDPAIIEFYYKDDELDDPFINQDHIRYLKIATTAQVETIKEQALTVNQALKKLFLKMGIELIDFKLEFGIDTAGNVLLADEISPDTCRLWDLETNQKLDKDVFRQNIGNLTTVYEEVLTRLQNVNH